MKKFTNAALVLGGGAPTGLGAIRSLGREGIDVYYIDAEKSAAVYSKYCKKSFIVPKISHSEEELRRILTKIRHQVGDADAVLFPASDLYALYLSDIMDKLSGYYVSAPKKESTEILVNKRKFCQSLVKQKIPHPATYFPKNLEDVRKIDKEISYPIFIKPYFSHLFWKRFGRKGFVVNSKRELLRHCELMKKRSVDVMIQEIVLGPPTDHVFLDGYFDRDINPKAFFVRRRLRMWPVAFGNSSLCESIPASEVTSLKETIFGYLKSISYQGIFSAELKKDSRDGFFKLLEINSRTSAWFNTLSAKCGVNIMLIAYLDAVGRHIEYSEHYETGVKWVLLRDDLRSAVKMMLNGDLGIREWISSLLGKKDHASYASDDLKPFIMDLTHTISSMIP